MMQKLENNFTPKAKSRMIEMNAKGMTHREIAERFSTSQAIVWRIINMKTAQCKKPVMKEKKYEFQPPAVTDPSLLRKLTARR